LGSFLSGHKDRGNLPLSSQSSTIGGLDQSFTKKRKADVGDEDEG
jgi:hypothetical protein